MLFKYGIPLTASMALLHWTVSQSVYVVKTFSHNSDESFDPNSSLTVAAYSSAGIIICKSRSLLGYHPPSCLDWRLAVRSPTHSSLNWHSPCLRLRSRRSAPVSSGGATILRLQCRHQRGLAPAATG